MKKALILTFLGLWVGLSHISAQKASRLLRQANDFYKEEQYEEAILRYERLLYSMNREIINVDASINLANSYLFVGQSLKAEALYKKVVKDVNQRVETYFHFGEALMQNAKYEEAKRWFVRYSKVRPEDPRGAQKLKACEAIEKIKPEYPTMYLFAAQTVNSDKSDEFGPVYYQGGIVLASDRNATAPERVSGKSYLDLYFAPLDSLGRAGALRVFDKRLRDEKLHVGPASFSVDGKNVYFSRSAKQHNTSNNFSLKIFKAEHSPLDDRWDRAREQDFSRDSFIYTHPSLSADGKTIYFASNRPGGFGGMDIWKAEYEYAGWSQPINLGPNINTEENESFPYVAANGTLYFASKGFLGFGGYDVYKAVPSDNGWMKAYNLGRPVNSSRDDTGFLLDSTGMRGFIVSSRAGSDDLYAFQLSDTPLEQNDADRAAQAGGFVPKTEQELIRNLNERLQESERPEPTTPEVVTPDSTPNTPTQEEATQGETTSEVATSETDATEKNATEVPVDMTSDTQTIPNTTEPEDVVEATPPPEVKDVQILITLVFKDKVTGAPLNQVVVQTQSKDTGMTLNALSNAQGEVILELLADDEYMITSSRPGYYKTYLPISTRGVDEDVDEFSEVPMEHK